MKALNSYHLKLIALITMMVDHFGVIFYPDLILFRIIGRVAFILYAFMLVEGFFLTHDLRQYAVKLLFWAVVSEVPYDIVFYNEVFTLQHQNIFFTLLLGLMGMYALSKAYNTYLEIIVIVITLSAAFLLRVDYSWYGCSVILLFYYLRPHFYKYFAIQGVNIFAALIKFMPLQFFAFLGIIPLLLYNGERGKKTGNIYYSFYAIHLIILGLIKNTL